MQIKKAIIPVAGWGTRRLPITKVIEKAMLPIGNRPLADYVVEDCAKAGIEEVYIVIDEKPFSQIKAYYEENAKLNNYLVARGKGDKVSLANTQRPGLTIHFYAQKDVDARYGSACPVAQVVEEDLARLMELVKEPTDSAMLATEIDPNDVEKYGVLKVEKGVLSGIYEKPKKEEAPSNLINISKYIMSPALLKRIVDYCHDHDFGPGDQEYLITDPIIDHIKAGEKIYVKPIQGEYLDGGSAEGWLHANNVVCGNK